MRVPNEGGVFRVLLRVTFSAERYAVLHIKPAVRVLRPMFDMMSAQTYLTAALFTGEAVSQHHCLAPLFEFGRLTRRRLGAER